MWARVEGAVRGAVWDVAWRLGTPPVAAALLALAAVQVGVTAALSSRTASNAFATSWGSWLIACAVVVDAMIALGRTAPIRASADGKLTWNAPDARSLGAFLTSCGYGALAVGFATSLATREGLEFRCAIGEPCDGTADQVVARGPTRPFSPGPFPVQFVVAAAERSADGPPAWVDIRGPGGELTRLTRFRPLWSGWGRVVRPVRTGDAFRYQIRSGDGEIVEDLFAKLDIDQPGKVDSIRSQVLPYRVFVRAVSAVGDPSAARQFEATVYRGKLSMASGTVSSAAAIAFEGHVVAFPEWRPWIQFEAWSDSGIPIALLGVVLAVTGIALRAAGGRSPSPRAAGTSSPSRGGEDGS